MRCTVITVAVGKRASAAGRATASSVTGAVGAGAVSGRTLARWGIRKRSKRKFCGLINKSVPPHEGSPEFLACRAIRSPSGSKKAQNLPPLEANLTPARAQDTLGPDVRWSFVGHRRLKVIGLWLALCRRTRQIVAYALDPRDDATARLLWERIPEADRRGPP